MHDDLVVFELSGGTWGGKPQVWKNFVMHVVNKYPDLTVWGKTQRLKQELQDNWHLTLELGQISGTLDNITAWQLAYA
jgi:hypothetical protein